MKKLITIAVILLVVAAAAAGAYYYSRKGPEPQINTAQVSRGDVIQSVGATGTLEAVRTFTVGSQVSGIVQNLYADFNSIVKKGQLLAKLDPSLMQTQIDQSKANLVRSQAELERLKVTLEDSRTKLARAQLLFAKKLATQNELETAQVAVKSADVQIRSQLAAITQSEASLNQSVVNLDHTDIYSPADGIVISRNVDVGQTVAASMQAPTLFMIAADLTRMQVRASVDEADVGLIRPGQHVGFRVDAYPSQEFSGTVSQVRLQAVVTQNVVTYVAVIDVPNPELKLKPGMTATVTIEIARRENALRIPNAALRFRPTDEIFEALNQEPPADLQRGQGGRGAGRTGGRTGGGTAGGQARADQAATLTPPAGPAASTASPAGPAAAAAAPGASRGPGATAPPVQSPQAEGQRAAAQAGERRGRGEGRSQEVGQAGPGGERGGFAPGQGPGGGTFDPAERQRRMEERLKTMSPEEREQFQARIKERGFGPDATAGGPGSPGQPGRSAGPPSSVGQQGPRAVAAPAAQSAQTIDQLFGPLQLQITSGRAWRMIDKQLKLVRLQLGISDGTYTEIVSNDIQAGTEIVTSIDLGTASTAVRTTTVPFMPGGMGGRGPGMGGPPGR